VTPKAEKEAESNEEDEETEEGRVVECAPEKPLKPRNFLLN
jgi:hypothetical protein